MKKRQQDKLVSAVLTALNGTMLIVPAAIPAAAITLDISPVQAATISTYTTINDGETSTGDTLTSPDGTTTVWQDINSGGKATGTTIGALCTQAVKAGGATEDVIVQSKGEQTLKNDTNSTVIAATRTVLNGGTQTVGWQATAKDTTINDKGNQIVNYGGIADGTIINKGGLLTANEGAKLKNITINAGGQETLSSSSLTVDKTTIATGGILYLDADGIWLNDLHPEEGAIITFSPSTTAYRTTTIKWLSGNAAFTLNSDLANGKSDQINIVNAENSTKNTVAFNDAGAGKTASITGSAVFATAPSGVTFTAAEIESGAYRYTPTITSATSGSTTTWTLTSLTGLAVINSSVTVDTGKTSTNETISAHGYQHVKGTATGTTILSGGHQIIEGGTAKNVTVKSGGEQELDTSGSGIVDNTTVEADGTLKADRLSTGKITNPTIKSGATLEAFKGSTVTNATLEDGYYFSGDTGATLTTTGTASIVNGQAKNLVLNTSDAENPSNWLNVLDNNSAENTTINGSMMDIYTNATATDTVMNGGHMGVNGGTAKNTIMNGNARQTVYTNGTAINTTLNSGAFQEVMYGGLAVDTTLKSGSSQTVYASGTLQNDIMEDGATMSISDGTTDGTMTMTGALAFDYTPATQDNTFNTITVHSDTAGFHNLSIKNLWGNTAFVLNTDLANGKSDQVAISSTAEGAAAKVQFQDSGFSNNKSITGNAVFATTPSSLTVTAAPTEVGAYSYTPAITSTTDGTTTTWALQSLTYSGASTTTGDSTTGGSTTGGSTTGGTTTGGTTTGGTTTGGTTTGGTTTGGTTTGGTTTGGTTTTTPSSLAASTTVLAANDQAAGVAVAWRSELNNIERRMGDLREIAGISGAWARYYHTKSTTNTSSRTTELSENSVQLGWDRDVNVRSGRFFYGGAFGYTDGSMSMNRGNGDYTGKTMALYGSWFGKKGHYTDVILKYGWMSNDYYDYNTSGTRADGSYDTTGSSISVEYGRKHKWSSGFYIDPQAELTAGHIESEKWITSDGTNIHTAGMDSVIGRAGLAIGQQAKNGTEWYTRLSLAREFNAQSKVTASSNGLTPVENQDSLKETWLEWSIGLNGKIGARSNYYLEYMRTNGDKVKTNYQMNAGFRWNF